jgi:HK97 family phage prohead protease
MIIRAFNIDDFEVRKLEDRQREFVISTERKDSHGTIIQMEGWKVDDYNRAGAFYYQHQTTGGILSDANPDNALGPAIAKKEGNKLIGIGKFEPENLNPLAEKIMGKVDYGTMKATSVGFMPEKGNWGKERDGQDPTTYYFTEQRLVEWSIVHVPSNPDAIKKSMESLDHYLLKQVEEHESEGFRKDFKRNLRDTKRHLEYLFNLGERRKFL